MPRIRLAAGAAASLALLAASVLPASGCSKPRGLTAEERSNLLPIEHEGWRQLGYRWDWKAFPVMLIGEGPLRCDPFGDLVVFQETGGSVSGIDAQRGETIWSNKPAGDLTRFTGIEKRDEMVYVTSEGELFGLDAQTGELVIRQRFEKLVATAPLMVGDLAIVGAASGEIMGHYLSAGIKVWGHDRPGTFETDPVLVGGIVGAVTSTGHVIFIDPVSQRQTGLNALYDGPDADPAASDTTMFIASRDQTLYALDAQTGRLVWKHLTPSTITEKPVYHEGVVYCSFPDSGLTALDANNGDVLWVSENQFGHVIGFRKGLLMVWDGRHLTTVEPQRGTARDSVELTNAFAISCDPFVDGSVYLTSHEGVVAKFVTAP